MEYETRLLVGSILLLLFIGAFLYLVYRIFHKTPPVDTSNAPKGKNYFDSDSMRLITSWYDIIKEELEERPRYFEAFREKEKHPKPDAIHFHGDYEQVVFNADASEKEKLLTVYWDNGLNVVHLFPNEIIEMLEEKYPKLRKP